MQMIGLRINKKYPLNGYESHTDYAFRQTPRMYQNRPKFPVLRDFRAVVFSGLFVKTATRSALQGQRLVIEQSIDDSGDLIGGFREITACPCPKQVCDGAGIKLRLIAVFPDIKPLQLEHTLLNDRFLQKMIQPPTLNQPQSFPLGKQIGVDCVDMLIDSAAVKGNAAVDFIIYGDAVLSDDIFHEIEIAVKGGSAYPGLADQLGNGDLRQLLGEQQLKQGVGDIR